MTIRFPRISLAVALLGGLLYGPVQAAAPNSAATLFGAAIAGDALEDVRGGAAINVSNESKLDGVVGQNLAYDLVTGSNFITEGSFAGASGFSTVIQNSGNNVLIQNSTIINLQVK